MRKLLLPLLLLIVGCGGQKPLGVGDIIPSPKIQAMGDGYLILAGGCRSCLDASQELTALRGRPTMFVFIQDDRQVPDKWEGCPTVVLDRPLFTQLNPLLDNPRLAHVRAGKIISLQQPEETYTEYASKN